MCQKQCRDENGFKCHTQSESHLRQMEMFSENSQKFMDEFSKEFEDGMMEIIRRKARSQRQNANQMYRDFIADKQHFHMNATVWETLTDFVMYLGRTGKCEVDETEKGWFLTYIDRDPETLARLDAHAKRERSELDSEEKHQRDLLRQVKAARKAAGEEEEVAPTELVREEAGGKIALALGGTPALAGGKAKLVAPPSAFFDAADGEAGGGSSSGGGGGGGGSGSGGGGGGGGAGGGGGSSSGFGGGKKLSAMEQMMRDGKARQEKADAQAAAEERAAAEADAAAAAARAAKEDVRKEYWVAEGESKWGSISSADCGEDCGADCGGLRRGLLRLFSRAAWLSCRC